MNTNISTILFSVIPLTLLLVSCGSTPERSQQQQPPAVDEVPYQVTEDYSVGVISYTVQRGDRLGDIALEFTGLSSNWREIADYNSITNPRSLREGSVLDIPSHMIPGYQRPATGPSTQAQPVLNTPLAQTTTLAVRRNQSTNVAPVVVTPINTNRNFNLNPIDSTTPNQASYAGSGSQVKVIGSYYPKSVYVGPDYSSKMLMRVAPGTLFVLDSQINDWYKVQTDSGSGYIRTNDAAIVQ